MPDTGSRSKGKTGKRAISRGNARGGFYGEQFTRAESFDLDEIDASTLNDEIGMLRVVIRRVFESAANEATDLSAWQEALDTLSAAANRLANLLKANQKLEAASSEVGAALRQALNEMVVEMQQAREEAQRDW